MGAASLATLRSALDRLWHAVESAEGDEVEWCLDLHLAGAKDTKWVQVLAGTLNLAYPSAEDPHRLVTRVLGEAAQAWSVLELEPGLFATFDLGDMDLRDLAPMLDRYFVAVLGADDSRDAIDVELTTL